MAENTVLDEDIFSFDEDDANDFEFEDTDIVRNALITKILKRYEE